MPPDPSQLLPSQPAKMHFDWTTGELAEGLRCYHGQQFWHAHEHWESVWLELDGQEKTFLQALIQVTAAFHHWQRKNPVGTASSCCGNALRRLDPLPAEFCGIAVMRCARACTCGSLRSKNGTGWRTIPFPRDSLRCIAVEPTIVEFVVAAMAREEGPQPKSLASSDMYRVSSANRKVP